MGQADIWFDDDISISDTEDYSFQSGDVTVHMTGDGWWRMIEALQDWLGECPHCERKVGERVASSQHSPSGGPAIPLTVQAEQINPDGGAE